MWYVVKIKFTMSKHLDLRDELGPKSGSRDVRPVPPSVAAY